MLILEEIWKRFKTIVDNAILMHMHQIVFDSVSFKIIL